VWRQRWAARCSPRREIRTTKPDPKVAQPEDLVERQLCAQRPKQLWEVDFTYVATWAGFVDVAFCIDVFPE
jgi:putative transposase